MSPPEKNRDVVNLSKKLSKVLRHTANDLGIPITPQGFVKVKDLLSHSQFRGVSLVDIETVVAKNDKNRYTLILKDNEWVIKANQGHSMETVTLLDGIRITDPHLVVIHATFSKLLPVILKEGLKPMRRLHIHFAEPGHLLRANCDVHIHINMEACLRDQIPFFKAPNGVVLSAGVNGVLPASYFLKIEYVEPIKKRIDHPRGNHDEKIEKKIQY